MQTTLAVRTCISLSSPITLYHLRAEGGYFILLDLQRHPVFLLSVSEVGVDPAYHLYAMTIFSSDEAQLIAMVLELRSTCLSSPNISHPCQMIEQAHVRVEGVSGDSHR